MIAFFLSRGAWLAAVVAIMFAVSLAQGAISYTMAFGPLRGLLPRDRSGIAAVLVVVRFGLVALMAAMWALKQKRALFRVIVIANALFTLALLIHTSGLIAVLRVEDVVLGVVDDRFGLLSCGNVFHRFLSS